jgi:hypothetical protein
LFGYSDCDANQSRVLTKVIGNVKIDLSSPIFQPAGGILGSKARGSIQHEFPDLGLGKVDSDLSDKRLDIALLGEGWKEVVVMMRDDPPRLQHFHISKCEIHNPLVTLNGKEEEVERITGQTHELTVGRAGASEMMYAHGIAN